MAPRYDAIGVGYAAVRRPDPRIEEAIVGALGDAATVVNVGAGAGSYEPVGRTVVAVEPSREMIAQRPPGVAPVVRAVGERLPIRDAAVDAALATLTIHHWPDWRAGLAEMVRVARKRVVVLTFDPRVSHEFWLVREYFPSISRVATDQFAFEDVRAALGGDVRPVMVPWDCTDGFLAAYWRRPERYLDPAVRAGISAFHAMPGDDLERGLRELAADLAASAWHDRHADLLERDEFDGGYRLIVRDKAAQAENRQHG